MGLTSDSAGANRGHNGHTTVVLEEIAAGAEPSAALDPIGVVVVHRWEIVELVGRGGTGYVFRVLDHETGETAAMKVLRPDLSAYGQLIERMAAEAVAMTILEHPNIARVVDMGSEGLFNFVVLEWAAGGSLAERIDRTGPAPLDKAIETVIPILDALELAHRRGIIHRDVKPANILLDENGRVMLADFGIARHADIDTFETAAGAILGSFAFMPPEQRLEPDKVAATADVYSVGATLYRLLTAQTPMDLFAVPPGDTRWKLVDRRVRPVLTRACQLRPEYRYQSAAAMLAALQRVLAKMRDEAAT